MNIVTVLIVGFLLMTTGLAFTQQTPQVTHSAVQLTEVGNKHCPVTGREIGEMGPAFKYAYKGKIYNLCCSGCPRTFNSDPDKYSKIADAESASQNK